MIESLFDVTVHFPLPNFLVEPNIILVAGGRPPLISLVELGPTLVDLVTLPFAGMLGLSLIGMYAVAKLYSHSSREAVLAIPESSGKIRDRIGLEVAVRRFDFSFSASMQDGTAQPNGPVEDASITTAKPVNVSAYAPSVVSLGDDFFIQIILHSPEDVPYARSLAEKLDKDTEAQHESVPLFLPLREGDEVRITVEGRGVEMDKPDQTIVWRGYPAQVAFGARLPTRL